MFYRYLKLSFLFSCVTAFVVGLILYESLPKLEEIEYTKTRDYYEIYHRKIADHMVCEASLPMKYGMFITNEKGEKVLQVTDSRLIQYISGHEEIGERADHCNCKI